MDYRSFRPDPGILYVVLPSIQGADDEMIYVNPKNISRFQKYISFRNYENITCIWFTNGHSCLVYSAVDVVAKAFNACEL